MKKILVLMAMALGISYANAQKIPSDKVPMEVRNAFNKQYPNVKDGEWEQEGATFEVGFKQNKMETSLVYDPSGKLLATETEIAVSALPKAVTDYINKNMAGKKITEATKIVAADGKISYEAEVDGTDYIIDEKGNLLDKETEKDDDDEKK